MGDAESKLKAIAIAPKFPALLSIFGSSFIVLHVTYARQGKRSTHHRILLGMSICDVFVSLVFFLGTWPIPRGSPNAFAAIGNQATCNFQGFFSQFSLAVAMYNASLSFYYVCKIRLGWSEEFITKKVEPYLHALSLTIGLATSTAAWVLKLYNNDSWECWISPNPQDCNESWKNGGVTNCFRGDNASLYRWTFYYALLWVAIVVVSVDMLLVYRFVLNQEVTSRRYDVESDVRRFKRSKRVAVQGYWYCGAFYMTWIFPTITRLTQAIIGDATPFALVLTTAMFVPIQGFFNFLVYAHPRWKSICQAIAKRAERNSLFKAFIRSSSQTESSRHLKISSNGDQRCSQECNFPPDTSGYGKSEQGLFLGKSLFLGCARTSSLKSMNERSSPMTKERSRSDLYSQEVLEPCNEESDKEEASESQHHADDANQAVAGDYLKAGYPMEETEETEVIRDKMKKLSILNQWSEHDSIERVAT